MLWRINFLKHHTSVARSPVQPFRGKGKVDWLAGYRSKQGGQEDLEECFVPGGQISNVETSRHGASGTPACPPAKNTFLRRLYATKANDDSHPMGFLQPQDGEVPVRALDARTSFGSAGVYDLHLPRHKRRRMIGGWQLSGISVVQEAVSPLTVGRLLIMDRRKLDNPTIGPLVFQHQRLLQRAGVNLRQTRAIPDGRELTRLAK